MDRLTRMIARLVTQRACLDFAAAEVALLEGVVLEIGLGKGRTYDRMRHLFPDREIYAFDLSLHCPPAMVPERDHLMLGDFRETLAAAVDRLGPTAALAHADFGTGAGIGDAGTAAAIAPLLARLMRPGGLVLSDRPLPGQTWRELPLPADAADCPYYIRRAD